MVVAPIRSTTQSHLDIDDIRNDLILLKDGSVAMVLQTSSVNFGLLSDEEQDATIYAYAALLNSLSFPIQILVRSQKKDVSDYLHSLAQQEQKQTNTLLKHHIHIYRKFVETTVKEGNVLDKKFYIILPFSHLELGLTTAVKTSLSKTSTLNLSPDFIVKKALTTLKPKRDHLFRQFARLGLKVRQLKTEELIELLFSTYNPDVTKTQKFTSSQAYAAPLTQAAIEPSPPPSLPGWVPAGTQPHNPQADSPPSANKPLSP